MPVEEIDYLDPLQAFAPWAGQAWSMLLDSAQQDGGKGRYSYICINPYRTLMVRDGQLFVDDLAVQDEPFAQLENMLGRNRLPMLHQTDDLGSHFNISFLCVPAPLR